MQGYGSVSSMLGQVALQRGRFIEARAAFLHAEELKAKGGASSVYHVYSSKQQQRCVGGGGGGGGGGSGPQVSVCVLVY